MLYNTSGIQKMMGTDINGQWINPLITITGTRVHYDIAVLGDNSIVVYHNEHNDSEKTLKNRAAMCHKILYRVPHLRNR